MKPKKNIGLADRAIRFCIAVVLLFFACWQASWILLAAALFVFFEVFFSWCVFYQIIGKNSCPIKKKKK